MGYVITAVCTVAAMSGEMTEYHRTYNLTYTYIVDGANCAWKVNFNDPTGVLDVFNTTDGQRALEPFNCTLTDTGCTTNSRVFSGTPYKYYSQDFEELNVTTGQLTDVQNFTYVLMPPVPEQPFPIYLVNNSASVFVTTSQYSQEIGTPLIGCVLSAGTTPYNATDLPATLSATASENRLPFTSYAMYSPPQNTSYTIYLNQLNVNPNSAIDLYFVCYNQQGASWASVQYNAVSSSSLPAVVVTPNNPGNDAVQRAGVAWSMAAISATVAAAALVSLMA